MDIIRQENCEYLIEEVFKYRDDIFCSISSSYNSEVVWQDKTLKDVKRVVFINSAPRSGSSLLFLLLQRFPQIYSLSGESVPFFKLNNISCTQYLTDVISSAYIFSFEQIASFSRDILSDCHVSDSLFFGVNDISHDVVCSYIDELALRFSLQWPDISFSYDLFREVAFKVFYLYLKKNNRFCLQCFYLDLIAGLRQAGYEKINPYYYDIPVNIVRSRFPELDIPSAPPCRIMTIEEPPFILLPLRKRIEFKDLSEKILLLKAPVNCYRMGFWMDVFKNAEIKVIHLVRNPMASVNGLYDGWQYRGFFSHNLYNFFSRKDGGTQSLAIAGYSDLYEWGKWWWKYDLPPDWEKYVASRLEEVGLFQWITANRIILQHKQESEIEYINVKYENIVQDVSTRRKELIKIAEFLGIDIKNIEQISAEQLPLVQTTKQPVPFRWRERESILLGMLARKEVRDLCYQLGYNPHRLDEWI